MRPNRYALDWKTAMRTGFLLLAACLTLACLRGSAAQEPAGSAMVGAMEQAMIDAIAQAEGSVVAIARVRKSRPGDTFPLEFRPDPFGRRLAPAPAPQPTDPDFIPNEYGTGVVVGARGLILTAHHVLGEDSEYYVTTHERKVYRAWVKGADPRSDLAVLAIDADDLTPIRFGNADRLQRGQLVIALGNPYAIARDGQASASWGIVSNLARKAPPSPNEFDPSDRSTLHHFGTLIQTDARLTLGTSGGPLLNRQGEMIGLCVALAATTSHERAAGYAIPVDATFHRVLATLKEGREVEYGFLGVRPTNLTPREMHAGVQGTRLSEVVPGTPADRFGLREGDILTAVDGTPIYDADGLYLEVGKLPVEAVARLAILRNGRPRRVDVTLSKYPVRGWRVVTAPAPAWRGLRVDYPTAWLDAARHRTRTPAFDEGVVVIDVEDGSPAWEAGLRVGMLVTHVEKTAVRPPEQFQAAVSGRPGPLALRTPDDPRQPVRTVPAE